MEEEYIEHSEQSQQEKTNEIYNSQMQNERVSNFISQTSPSETSEKIDLYLRGYRKRDGNYVKVSKGIPEDIRNDFMDYCAGILDNNTRMSNLDEKMINGIMESSIEWIRGLLEYCADENNLKNYELEKIGDMLISVLFITLLRALRRTEGIDLFDSLKLGENISPMQQQSRDKPWYKFW
ncbi:MAG: hypothetical protein ACOCUD_01715 [Bacillota bacterium]